MWNPPMALTPEEHTMASCLHLHPGGIVGSNQGAARQPWCGACCTRAVGCAGAVPMPALPPRTLINCLDRRLRKGRHDWGSMLL